MSFLYAPGPRFNRVCRVLLPGVLLLVLIAALIDAPEALDYGLGDKMMHLLTFFMLGLLSESAYPRSPPLWRLASALLAYGLLIECLQYLLPWREFSMLDWAADGAGLLLWLLIGWPLRRSALAESYRDKLAVSG